MSYQELIKEVQDIASEKAGISDEIMEGAIMEYLCYYSLYQLIHNNCKDVKQLLPVLHEIERIGSIPASMAYNYIEKDIARILTYKMIK
jgi:hypothetical protein